MNEKIEKQIADLAKSLNGLPATPYRDGALAHLDAVSGLVERHEEALVIHKTAVELEQKRVAAHEAHTRREREHLDARRRSQGPVRPQQQVTIPDVTTAER